ncbi:MAG: helix-turn-helix domain-containing protein [Gemmatimonadota bacterium]
MRIETPRQLGALLRDGRKKAEMTQLELAERVHASLRWVQMAERGEAGASVGRLLRALNAVGVHLEANLGGRQASVPPVVTVDVDQIIAEAGKPATHVSKGH